MNGECGFMEAAKAIVYVFKEGGLIAMGIGLAALAVWRKPWFRDGGK